MLNGTFAVRTLQSAETWPQACSDHLRFVEIFLACLLLEEVKEAIGVSCAVRPPHPYPPQFGDQYTNHSLKTAYIVIQSSCVEVMGLVLRPSATTSRQYRVDERTATGKPLHYRGSHFSITWIALTIFAWGTSPVLILVSRGKPAFGSECYAGLALSQPQSREFCHIPTKPRAYGFASPRSLLNKRHLGHQRNTIRSAVTNIASIGLKAVSESEAGCRRFVTGDFAEVYAEPSFGLHRAG
ncbi:hypothetical protein CIB48_g2905 [Xylaria polymorpha]|nr:hypothetical protein CIB48_g2905 [Xylaria polymorpha]